MENVQVDLQNIVRRSFTTSGLKNKVLKVQCMKFGFIYDFYIEKSLTYCP